jgi:hypothetical protein
VADDKKSRPVAERPEEFFSQRKRTNLRRWPPPSSRRDLASVVLLGGDLISRSALAKPDPERFSLRGGSRVGPDFRAPQPPAASGARNT